MSQTNPVRTLNAEVARKIAAGEVIDRPNAVVRELIDNAIDSGATQITVEITGGGIEKIRVIDDGSGMTKEDLQNCARPHATSKIATEVDLMNLSTLGFRGEALASIAAVARLSITSGGFKMRASITEDHIIEPVAVTKGTIVQSEGLFENFPARRQFLKRPATEGVMCRNTFIEKAVSRPDISFRFISDGETKLDLPAGQTLRDRFVDANRYEYDRNLFYEVKGSASGSEPDWSFSVITGEPAVSRSNKKDIYIYTNGRRIQEYSLVQAVEYGGQGFFPNGTYPVALVFITINPKLVDFNIHPAKKEARFYDLSELHHAISSSLRTFYHTYTYQNFANDKPADEPTSLGSLPFDMLRDRDTKSSYERHITYKSGPSTSSGTTFGSGTANFSTSGAMVHDLRSKFMPSARTSTSSLAEQAMQSFSKEFTAPQKEKSKIRYIGPALGTFLLAEKNNSLYIIDQHAAHERILFDKIMNNQGGRQQLLIPYKIRTESKTQDNQLEKLKERLSQIGFDAEKKDDGYWEITSIPERWTGTEYDFRALLFVKNVEPEQIIRSIAAMTACKAAVKDGYVLDDETAARLVEQAFTLEDPHCPHGRPIYTVLSKDKLFELVKRT
ncbi:MAG: DNA mismatch repair endonuclease MutL [Treponema sp.]|nr:DNA mismatch repair endonuclease MutL [Treponema sp.]